MILWKSKTIKEVAPVFPNIGLRAWRWIFEIDSWCIGFYHQVKYEKYKGWRYASTYYYIGISKWFHLGSSHDYYDGPHCAFSLGFLHFCYTGSPWNGSWCKKCMPDNCNKD